MMEEEKNELKSSLGSLSVGGLVYIAKMAGLNDVGKLMMDLSKIEEKILKDKINDYENVDEVESCEFKNLIDQLLEEL
jgi:hypothetical protein